MAVVKKAQSITNVSKKKEIKPTNVQSTRQPSRMGEMGDTDFGELDVTKDGLIVSYDSNTNKFILKTTDELLSTSAEDSDIPDDFVRALEGELNLGQIQIDNLDGGLF